MVSWRKPPCMYRYAAADACAHPYRVFCCTRIMISCVRAAHVCLRVCIRLSNFIFSLSIIILKKHFSTLSILIYVIIIHARISRALHVVLCVLLCVKTMRVRPRSRPPRSAAFGHFLCQFLHPLSNFFPYLSTATDLYILYTRRSLVRRIPLPKRGWYIAVARRRTYII